MHIHIYFYLYAYLSTYMYLYEHFYLNIAQSAEAVEYTDSFSA